MKRTSGTTMLKALLLLLALPLGTLTLSPAASADVGDSATGSGSLDSGSDFAFSATGGAESSGAGTLQQSYAPGGFVASGSVRCLIVDGNNAVIAGEVTTSTFPEYLGYDMVYWVTDNGTPGAGRDRVGSVFYTVHQSCDFYAAFLGNEGNLVVTGEVTVVDADRTAAEQLADLIAQLQTAPVGAGSSFIARLQAIAHSFDGDTPAACAQLNAFENEVRAQTGKKLTQGEADGLLAATGAIKTETGCP
jgi:hypothetical protein